MKYWIYLTAALLLSSTPSLAQSNFTGNARYNGCKTASEGISKDPFNEGVCVGLVTSIFFWGSSLNEENRFCPPTGSNPSQALKIVLSHMNSHPEILHLDFRSITGYALRAAWPCTH
ncbi:Rap1a/Tai family immunity protein [Microvirga lotononidis]|uniref:Rap1a/Tai family immunity protein n=1 Tax=Microvirga lotononidis TaxID=864069 RepID=UPI003898F192